MFVLYLNGNKLIMIEIFQTLSLDRTQCLFLPFPGHGTSSLQGIAGQPGIANSKTSSHTSLTWSTTYISYPYIIYLRYFHSSALDQPGYDFLRVYSSYCERIPDMITRRSFEAYQMQVLSYSDFTLIFGPFSSNLCHTAKYMPYRLSYTRCSWWPYLEEECAVKGLQWAIRIQPLYLGPFVKLRAQSADKEYTISKALFRGDSSYFPTMFNGLFAEEQKHAASLAHIERVVSIRSVERNQIPHHRPTRRNLGGNRIGVLRRYM